MRERIAPTLIIPTSERGARGAPASRNANSSKRPGGAFPKSSVIGRSSSLSSLALASAGGGRSSSPASAAAPADERTRSSLASNSMALS
jgi:hypothetical protein